MWGNRQSGAPVNNTTLEKLTDNGDDLFFDGKLVSGTTGSPPPSVLEGKTWNVLGDSLSQPSGTYTSKSYYEFVKEWANMLQINNYGTGGSTIATPWSPMSERYTSMSATADYITVLGGINDHGRSNTPLGVFTDTANTTFYGGCHVLFKGLLAKYPSKKVGYIAPHFQTTFFSEVNTYGLNQEAYMNAAIEVAKCYGLPVLDLFHEGGISVRVTEQKTLYTVDGLHLNLAGHEWIARKIHAWLLTL